MTYYCLILPGGKCGITSLPFNCCIMHIMQSLVYWTLYVGKGAIPNLPPGRFRTLYPLGRCGEHPSLFRKNEEKWLYRPISTPTKHRIHCQKPLKYAGLDRVKIRINPIPTGKLLLEQPPTKNWKKRPQIIEVQKIEYLEV